MKECPYLLKNGKKCCNKLSNNQIICNKHNNKEQKGGFIYEMIYPMGASVGAATFGLYRMNNMINTWYHSKHQATNKSQRPKNNNRIVNRKK